MNQVKAYKRISLEIIRIIALCLVIYNHTGENGFELFRYAENRWLWYIAVFIDVICKAGVPLFFMISGALLLGKEESLKDIFLKRVLRYIIILVLFSFIYYIRLYVQNPEYGFSIKYFIKYIYSTQFIDPFWFLYYYIAFLIMLPVLRAVVKNLDKNGYILLALATLIPQLLIIPEHIFDFGRVYFPFGLSECNVLYPLLGYGIANVFTKEFYSIKTRVAMVIVLFINYACSVVTNMWEFQSSSEYSGQFIDMFSFVPAVFVFYFVLYFIEIKEIAINEHLRDIIAYVGSCAFCIYIFEDMLRGDIFLRLFRISSNQTIRIALCIPYTIGIIASGVVISTILRRIPFFNRLKI